MADVLGILRNAFYRPMAVVLPVVFAAHMGCATDVDPNEELTVTITPYSVVLIGVGDTIRLNATVRNADGEEVTGGTPVWESSNARVASVDQSGLVTAHAGGGFVIKASVDGISTDKRGSVIIVTGSGVEALDRSVALFMDRWGVPGLAMAVAKDGRLVVARGYGFADFANEEPVEPDALFRIASVGKSIKAVTILKLREEGRVDLDEKAFDILVDLWPTDPSEVGDERLQDITLEMLLHHGGGWDSGIPVPLSELERIADELGMEGPISGDVVVRYLIGQPLEFTPGTRYEYSNVGYCVLGRVVERITGVGYEEHVQNNILAPRGITRMQIGSGDLSDRAPGEVRYYGSHAYGMFLMKAFDGWIASTLDLVRFITAVDGIETPPDLLNGASRSLMGGPPPWWDGSPGYYGMGWGRDTGRWMHGGGMNGALSWIEMRDDGLAFAVLMNTNAAGDVPGNVFSWIDAVDDWPDHDLWPQFSNE